MYIHFINPNIFWTYTACYEVSELASLQNFTLITTGVKWVYISPFCARINLLSNFTNPCVRCLGTIICQPNMIWKIARSGAGHIPREPDWGGAKLLGQQHELTGASI